MHLTFGVYLDGVGWSHKPASMGELTVGPYGMLELLETRLGLTTPNVHPAERINQYMKRLEACDGEGKWFHESFETDPWATAKQMLFWRDQLIEAGWGGQIDPDGSARLTALAELEQTASALDMGREDRLQQVLLRLPQTSQIAISQIQLHDPLELLPPVWQKVIAELKNLAVTIAPAAQAPLQTGSTNLACVQGAMNAEPRECKISGEDESLLLIEAANEWEAAENLALWLGADVKANRDVTIICGASADVLDQALRRHGLPQLGDSDSSRWRESLQVLPLIIANAWKPLNIFRLVELLSSPLAPLPGYAAGYLLKAISEEPGIGGDEWNEALEKIASRRQELEQGKGRTVTQEEAAAFAAGIDQLLAGTRFDPDAGIPEEELKQLCQLVIESLAWRVKDDPVLGEAVSHAREMQKLAEGKGTIPRVTVERMLDSVIGQGGSAPDRFRQAAPWRVVHHPGQITDQTKTLIWWGFVDQSVSPHTYWSESERRSLEKTGVMLEDSRSHRSREAQAWKRGFSQAREHVLMFYPAAMQGEPAYHSPFWDEIRAAAVLAQPAPHEKETANRLTRKCAGLEHGGRWQLAGRKVRLQKAKISALPVPEAARAIPRDIISQPQRLSYTRMKTMIACPMSWALEYHAGLKAPAAQVVPTGNQMIGTFCHKIVHELYTEEDGVRTPEEAYSRSLELYDLLVESMAAELLVEGRELENSRTREAMALAVKHLVAEINRRDLIVEKSEEKLEGDFLGGIPFRGFADLRLRDRQGNTFIFDLKWTSSGKYHKQELEDGYALQLATYAWLLGPGDSGNKMHAGYFLLAQGEMLSNSELLSDEPTGMPYSLEEIWEMGSSSWTERFRELSSGVMEATGLRDRQVQSEKNLRDEKLQQALISERRSQGLLYQETPCRFCDYATLCGMDAEQ